MRVFAYHPTHKVLRVFEDAQQALAACPREAMASDSWLFFDADGQPLLAECGTEHRAFLRPWASCASCSLPQVLPYVLSVEGTPPMDTLDGVRHSLGCEYNSSDDGYDRPIGRRNMMRAQMEQELTGLFTMAALIEARDPFTVGHAWRVSRYSRLVAENSVQSEEVIAQVAIAGFLHDLGKIGISDSVLMRPERLIESEYEVVKEHAALGARLLSGHPMADWLCDVIRHHHECFDGTGYPDGLSGLKIPLAARIVSVCDAFDAMTSTRPWRRAMPLEAALEVIESGYGRQFDQDFAERLVRLARAGDLSHIIGHSDIGVPVQECPSCGPSVMVFRTHEPGDKVYCRQCANEFVVRSVNHTLHIVPTGNKGRPSVAVPEPDAELISRLILDALGHLPD